MSAKHLNPEDDGYKTSEIDETVPECYSTVVENPEDSKSFSYLFFS